MTPEVQVHVSDKFKVLYNLPKDVNTLVFIGGRGGMKTYEASKWITYQATIKKKRCAVLRDEKSTIKESILNEILQRYDTANESGLLDQCFAKLDNGIKDRKTGEMAVFTKGFRSSDNQKKANLKSISNVDVAIIEEAEDIRDVDKFNTFADSIRKEGSIIGIILNTPDIGHWVLKRYFNLEQITFDDVPELKGVSESEIDGYFKIVPKVLKGFLCIQASFEDNPYLPAHIVESYKNYGNPNSEKYNLHYYLTAIKGFASSGRKGQVLKKVKPIKLVDYLKLPFKEITGLDFGTSAPAGIVGVKFDRNKCYARQLNYKPLSTLEIGRFFCSRGYGPSDKIVADCADAKAIDKLKKGFSPQELSDDDLQRYPQLVRGFYVVPCTKGTDSIRNGIDLMDGMELYVVEEHTDFWTEVREYVYEQDKYGNYTNDPKKGGDHLIDPWRYVVTDQRGKKKFDAY
jgi:phage terminase large subunit